MYQYHHQEKPSNVIEKSPEPWPPYILLLLKKKKKNHLGEFFPGVPEQASFPVLLAQGPVAHQRSPWSAGQA